MNLQIILTILTNDYFDYNDCLFLISVDSILFGYLEISPCASLSRDDKGGGCVEMTRIGCRDDKEVGCRDDTPFLSPRAESRGLFWFVLCRLNFALVGASSLCV